MPLLRARRMPLAPMTDARGIFVPCRLERRLLAF